VYLSDTWYAVTGSICHRQHLLKSAVRKELLRDQLETLVTEFRLRLAAWVILDNHYHVLVKSGVGDDIPRFLGRLHGRISFELNKLDVTRGRRVWDNYWDTCIRGEADYWTRFNYIHHNPVKHRYATRMGDWAFSSYNYYLRHKGEDWLADVIRRYPVIDFSEPF
jgi:putative transposase